MASGPDLFVVCRSCGREVSPYITECPYCGNRLRKRAPKLERGGTPKPPKPPRKRPSLGRLKPGEIPGIRAERRPYATILLVLAALVVTLLSTARVYSPAESRSAAPSPTSTGARSRRCSSTARPATRS